MSTFANTKQRIDDSILQLYSNSKVISNSTFASLNLSSDLIQTLIEASLRRLLLLPNLQTSNLFHLFESLLTNQIVSKVIIFGIIEEYFDSCDINQCIDVFSSLESNNVLLDNLAPNKGDGLIFLRICNELLRRFTKSLHAAICGRVITLVASVFPVCERSGVNLRGDFNIDNTTSYDQSNEEPLYQNFWSLQSYLRNPTTLFVGDEFDAFSKKVDYVLGKFERQRFSESDVKMSSVKYLTGQSVFKLQVQDVEFRKSWLLQLLIVMDYLDSLSALKMSKSDRNSKQVQYKLNANQEKWVGSTIKDATKLLQSVASASYVKAVEMVLQHEKNWAQWKKDSCPPFDNVTPVEYMEHEDTPIVIPEFSLELESDGMIATRDPFYCPSVQDFLQELKEQIDPDNQIDSEYRLSKDDVYSWKATRLSTRNHLHLLRQSDGDIEKLAAFF